MVLSIGWVCSRTWSSNRVRLVSLHAVSRGAPQGPNEVNRETSAGATMNTNTCLDTTRPAFLNLAFSLINHLCKSDKTDAKEKLVICKKREKE